MEEVWERDSLLDIFSQFLHLERKEKRQGTKKVIDEKIIFPRYHQLDCLRRLIAASRANGPGKNYLIQHSAGRGT